jgi:hypothetical protein
MRPTTLVCFDGQSRNNTPLTNPELAPPSIAMAGRGLPWANVSINAWGWVLLTSNGLPPTTRVDPLVKGYARTVLVMYGGEGDMGAFTGHTAAQAVVDAETYADARRAAGWDIIIGCTWAPAPGLVATVSDADRTGVVNPGLLASDSFDYVVDLAADPRLAVTEDIFFDADTDPEDYLHYTVAGAAIAGEIIGTTLDTALL